MWWLRLGITLERIAPGHPEQNGRHERLHLTLKTEATHPAAPNILQQQARFDTFIDRFNQERPHQALNMKTPSSLSRWQPHRSRAWLQGAEKPDHVHRLSSRRRRHGPILSKRGPSCSRVDGDSSRVMLKLGQPGKLRHFCLFQPCVLLAVPEHDVRAVLLPPPLLTRRCSRPSFVARLRSP